MTMTSNQVKLLSLAARINGIEFEVQQLEKQKNNLSSETGRAHEIYLNSLDMTKFQYKKILSNGNIIYRDATLNSMENGIIPDYNGEISNYVLFLKDKNSDTLLLTPSIADYYNLNDSEEVDLNKYCECLENIKYSMSESVSDKEENKTIIGYCPIKNTVKEPFEEDSEYVYTPVYNEKNGIYYDCLDKYAKFNKTHSEVDESVYCVSESSELDDLISAKYCQINSAVGLKKLEKLSHESAASGLNINIILTDNIDMFGYVDWAGIRNFSGIFDGNGYVISNLTGIQGLFANTIGANVKNIGLDNINIKGNLSYIGGLIGYAKTTNISNCYTTGNISNNTSSRINDVFPTNRKLYSCGTGGVVGFSYSKSDKNISINNIFSSADVKGTDGVGGLIGVSMTDKKHSIISISNAYSIGSVAGNKDVGGFIGIMNELEDKLAYITTIKNSYSGGNVIGSNDVGGFIGAYLCNSRSRGQSVKVKNCNSTGSLTGLEENVGAFVGHLYLCLDADKKASLLNSDKIFEACAFADIHSSINPFGSITTESGSKIVSINNDGIENSVAISDLINQSNSEFGVSSFYFAGSVPSVFSNGKGAYFSNIKALFQKADITFDENIDDMICKFLLKFNNNNSDNTKLWYLNNAICAYLTGIDNHDLVEKLYSDVVNRTMTETEVYQAGEDLQGLIGRGCGKPWKRSVIKNIKKGIVTVPSVSTIIDEVYYSMKNAGIIIDKRSVKSYFDFYSVDVISDRISLANINDKLTNNKNLKILFDSIVNSGCKYYDDTKWYDISKWDVVVESKHTKLNFITSSLEKFDNIHKPNRSNDCCIMKNLIKWFILQRGFKVVTNEQASSSCWYSNILKEGDTVLTTFNPDNIFQLVETLNFDSEFVSKDVCDFILGIEEISLEKSAYLTEMSDEISIKRAESIYKSNLKIIEKKDKCYDMQIETLEKEKDTINDEIKFIKNNFYSKIERKHSFTN